MKTAPSRWSAAGPLFCGFLTLAALVGGFGGWSVLTNLAGAIIAPGHIEVAQNRQIVQHPDGGVVQEINVSEGETVKVGDVLVRLDGTLLRSELSMVENQFLELRARRARLEAERDDAPSVRFADDLPSATLGRREIDEINFGQTKLFDARRESFGGQIDLLDKQTDRIASQIEGIDAQRTAISLQLTLLAEERDSQQQLLDKGLAQAARLLALKREEARLQGNVGQLESDRAQAEARVTEIEIEKLQLASTRRENAISELRDVASRALELAERRRALAERLARLDIRAPVSGTVLGLQVTAPRSVIRAADPVLYLIPQDRPLVIFAQIPTFHVDEVHVGQEVRLHFAAFASRTTPELVGRVSMVSADALQDARSQLPYYSAEITLEPGQSDRLDGAVLLPGMPVEAFIRTRDRTPLAYLIKPFTDYFTRSFRET